MEPDNENALQWKWKKNITLKSTFVVHILLARNQQQKKVMSTSALTKHTHTHTHQSLNNDSTLQYNHDNHNIILLMMTIMQTIKKMQSISLYLYDSYVTLFP